MKAMTLLSITLCGAVLVIYGLGSALMELIGMYSQALSDPLGDSLMSGAAGPDPAAGAPAGSTPEKEVAGRIMRFALFGAAGAILFTVGIKAMQMQLFRGKRDAGAERNRDLLEAELEAARARRDAKASTLPSKGGREASPPSPPAGA